MDAAANLKFLHLKSDVSPKDLSSRDDGYFVKPIIPSKVVSVGYKVIENPAPDGAVHFHIEGQVAKCCMKDNFNRKIARKIIEGRYKKRGPSFKFDLPDDWTSFEVYKLLEQEFHPDVIQAKLEDQADAVFELED